MAQAPETFQPVEGQRGLDAERQLLFAHVGPVDVGILDVRNEISAFEVTITVRLEPQPYAELVAMCEVVGEIEPPKPQPMLSFDLDRGGAADVILVTLVVPVVVTKHEPADLVGWKFGFRELFALGKVLSREPVLEIVQINRILAVEDDGFGAGTVTWPLDHRTEIRTVALDERVVCRRRRKHVDSVAFRDLVVEER